MTTPDNTGTGSRKAAPFHTATAMPNLAFSIISDMENDTCAIRDFATILVMASAGANEVNASEAEPALVRFGWLIRDYADRLETKRTEASGLLQGLVIPGKGPRQ